MLARMIPPRLLAFGLVLTAFGAAAPAQALHGAGALQRMTSTAWSRGSLGTGPGELVQRFDADELTGFGVEAAFPGMHVVRGVMLGIRDFGFSTPNNLCDISIYTEDPARPNYPDLTQPLGGMTGYPAMNTPFGYQYITFPNPVLAPAGRDVFLGVRVPGANQSFGGVRLLLHTSSSALPTYDLAGPGLPSSPPEASSYRLDRNTTTNALTYLARSQYLVDLLTVTPSGMPTAITNQASYPVSTFVPGSTSLLSGLHPDAATPPLNAGRADDVAFMYSDFVLPPGFPVAFLASFDGFGPTVPLAQHVPGSVGGVCLPSASLFVLGIQLLDSSQQAWMVTTLPPAARNLIRGVAWAQQAIGFDVVVGVLRGSQCGKQTF
jgi:hypothetical protein